MSRFEKKPSGVNRYFDPVEVRVRQIGNMLINGFKPGEEARVRKSVKREMESAARGDGNDKKA